MLVITRHAERGDNEFPRESSQIEYDPPITLNSAHTIKQTASELIQIFKENNVSRIRVQSSKFLRCLMTAERLIGHFKEAGLQIIEPKVVSNMITQYMRKDWFSKYPLHHLIYDTPNINKYLTTSNWKEQKIEQPHPFPENYILFHQRIGKFKDKLTFPSEGECLIIITHGLVVRDMCWRLNQPPDYSAEIKYCGYAAFKMKENLQILVKSKL